MDVYIFNALGHRSSCFVIIWIKAQIWCTLLFLLENNQKKQTAILGNIVG